MTPQLYSLKTSMSNILKLHHPVIFIAAILLSLSVAVYLLYGVLSLSDVDTSSSSGSTTAFDKKTADRISDLQVSSEKPEGLTFPEPRSNPFVEKK